jgi:rod shape-determining protein MreC
MQKGINSVGSYISKQLEALTNIRDLLDENEKLKRQLEAKTLENSILTQDKYETDRLRELFEVNQKYPDYPKVAARVMSKDTSNFYSVFTIDKGADDGIAVDNNVLAGNGLVGIVTEVGKNYAKVRSIIDDASYVSGMFLKTSDTCDVKGNLELLDEGVIRIEAIPLNAEIEDGYEVVTSHISNKYLQGILIGYASDIKLDSSNLAKVGYLRPAVDFQHLEDVLIITTLKEKLEDLDDK